MISVYAKATCGCCIIEMKFETEESAKKRLDEIGVGHATVVDDEGKAHADIDLFYGYSFSEDEVAGRGLGYLADRIGGKA